MRRLGAGRHVQDTFPHLVPAIEPLCTAIRQFRVRYAARARRAWLICTPRRIRETSSLKYAGRIRRARPHPTTTMSRDGMTIVYCPMCPDAMNASSGTPFHAPPRFSQNSPP